MKGLKLELDRSQAEVERLRREKSEQVIVQKLLQYELCLSATIFKGVRIRFEAFI